MLNEPSGMYTGATGAEGCELLFRDEPEPELALTPLSVSSSRVFDAVLEGPVAAAEPPLTADTGVAGDMTVLLDLPLLHQRSTARNMANASSASSIARLTDSYRENDDSGRSMTLLAVLSGATELVSSAPRGTGTK